eukprot:402729-Pleurochrysis_carterae.AAC.1
MVADHYDEVAAAAAKQSEAQADAAVVAPAAPTTTSARPKKRKNGGKIMHTLTQHCGHMLIARLALAFMLVAVSSL